MSHNIPAPGAILALAFALTACGPRLARTVENGTVLPNTSEAVIQQARVDGEAERARLAEQRAASGTAALASCTPEICEAVARGELVIGMTEAEVLAATRTTAEAWDTRPNGSMTLMTPRTGGRAPSDAVGEIAYIGLQNGTVSSYTYREPQGYRMVASAADAAPSARAAAQADALLRQGDEYAAAGRLDLALDRYDRADVIRPGHSETTFRIASTLDKSLRPIEAIMRYQLFIHQLELEKINARGEAAAKIAEAIARAHERIIVLEQR